MSLWYVYIVKCFNDSFYTGITNDIERRLMQHNTGKGAKYIKMIGKPPVKLVYVEFKYSRSDAAKREWAIKQLTRKEKEKLIRDEGL